MKRFIVLLCVLSLSPFTALAQQKQGPAPSPGSPDAYYPDFPAEDAMKGDLPDQTITGRGVQYGAWITPVIISKIDGGSTLTSSDITARAWFKTNLWNDSYFFIRGKYVRHDVLQKEGSANDKNFNLGDLDLGFISMGTHTKLFRATVGRKYFTIGSGLVLNNRADGVEFEVITKYVKVQAMACYTGLLLRQDNPFALSDRDISRGARRVFGGGTVAADYKNQTIYGFMLGQFDMQKEPWYLKKSYNSQYYGIGAYGVIAKALVYNTELIHERGESYTSGTNKKGDITAFASIVNVSYFFDAPTRPFLVTQYAFGSGDRNRNDYRLPNGNNFGRDHGFMSFGTYVGGYGLQPVLGNLHVFRAGVGLAPLQTTGILMLKGMSIIAKYSLYIKHRLGAAINYGYDAPRPSRVIGHGVDVSLRWLILSDIGAFFNYGVFLPEDAYYAIANNRHFFMSGFNISF